MKNFEEVALKYLIFGITEILEENVKGKICRPWEKNTKVPGLPI